MDVDNLISGASAFSKCRLHIWKFSIHLLLKPSLKDFEHYLASMTVFYHSMYSYHLFLIYSACQIHTVSVLYCVHLCMKCSLGISYFLKEISGLSHSIVFLYFFALFTLEDIFISPCYSLEICIQMTISFLFSFAFHFFSQLLVRPP